MFGNLAEIAARNPTCECAEFCNSADLMWDHVELQGPLLANSLHVVHQRLEQVLYTIPSFPRVHRIFHAVALDIYTAYVLLNIVASLAN